MLKDILTILENICGGVIVDYTRISGGCIAQSYKLRNTNGEFFFLKTGFTGDLFQCEANSLNEIRKSKTIRIPKVLAVSNNFLLLEHIENKNKNSDFFRKFGRQVAQMHQYTSSIFGFYNNNYIGSTPQINIASDQEESNWTDFYFNKRLLYQFRLAEKNGYANKQFASAFQHIEKSIHRILEGSEERPSLLHGDLWGGNYMVDFNENPVLIDPAVYYGHREADLAMTKMFGGFPPSFYQSYNEHFPLPDGAYERENIYLLYHYFNHLNLFGKGYYGQTLNLMRSYSKR